MKNIGGIARGTLREIAAREGTPTYVYDARTIEARLADLAGYDRVRFAQKANPNLAVLDLLRRRGAWVDAVSAGEIARARTAGFEPRSIAYTADVFDDAALEWIAREPIAVNCGSVDMLATLARVRPGGEVTLRVNPGFGHGHAAGVRTGGDDSKHGIWHRDVAAAADRARRLGLACVGLHTHVGSGSDLEHLVEAAPRIADLARDIGRGLRTISAGGGLPVPYRDDAAAFDVARHLEAWRACADGVARSLDTPIELEVEPGRFLVAQAGVLITRVLGTKRSGTIEYAICDAGFHTLLRPAMYGAFHRIVALDPRGGPGRAVVIAGPLCESGDVLTLNEAREPVAIEMPPLLAGDLLVVRDVGAYGIAMASRYNSQPLPAEVLIEQGRARLVRRRERHDELFAAELGLGDAAPTSVESRRAADRAR